jgi:hypothetical protein
MLSAAGSLSFDGRRLNQIRRNVMTGLGVHQSALLTDLALCVNRYRLFSPGWYGQLRADEAV